MTALSDASATGTEAGDESFTYDANGNMTSSVPLVPSQDLQGQMGHAGQLGNKLFLVRFLF
jgi:hypothetical protein